MKRGYMTAYALLLCGLAVILAGCVEKEHEFDKGVNVPTSSARLVHPRLFLTEDDIPVVKANASGRLKDSYDEMKSRIDKLMGSDIVFEDPLAATGENTDNHEYGFRASEAALLWLVSGDKAYLDFTKTLLKEITGYYELRVSNNLNIHWYIFSTICVLCAYDWIYNDLTQLERQQIGIPLYKVMYDVAWHGSGTRPARYRENISDYKSGCYGPAVLPWYLGITFYGEGIDDKACADMMSEGYALHMQMADFRRQMAGEKGGGATACAQYSFGYYPLADFNFIHTYRSAYGVDISERMDYVLKYLDYLDWIALPGRREYGFGDVHHYNCLLPHTDINYHIGEIANLYSGNHPDVLAKASRLLALFSQSRETDTFPFIRFLHKVFPSPASGVSSETDVHSIYFDTMGQVYMRSGTGDDDTYAMFVSGGVPTQHKHYDNNNFIIYHKGYRALDSGTRPEPGNHLSHYYCRTVAHNCITIRMPGETFPDYWGEPASTEEELPVPNDGGQRELLSSELLALEETDDYVYLASDATASYHPSKAELVMREFIYCMPDLFVVFDRVTSTDAAYPKSWLLHTASEPQMNGTREWTETSDGGRMICRTLLPEDAVIEKIGGDGKQFWSDGRNWPLPVLTPDDYGYSKRFNIPPATHPQVGQWRVEVRPGHEAGQDIFMHIMQVGDTSLSSLPDTEVFEDGDAVGVEFTYNSKPFRLTIDRMADYGCSIDVE